MGDMFYNKPWYERREHNSNCIEEAIKEVGVDVTPQELTEVALAKGLKVSDPLIYVKVHILTRK